MSLEVLAFVPPVLAGPPGKSPFGSAGCHVLLLLLRQGTPELVNLVVRGGFQT